MTSNRSVQTLSAVDAAYIAGIVDGEGTIALTRRHRNEHRQLEISISNTDICLLMHIKARIGAGRIAKKRTYDSRHTASGAYLISNRQALHLLEQIRPYLRTYKARRAELVLRNYVKLTPRNGYYTPEIERARAMFIDLFLAMNPAHSRMPEGSSPTEMWHERP